MCTAFMTSQIQFITVKIEEDHLILSTWDDVIRVHHDVNRTIILAKKHGAANI